MRENNVPLRSLTSTRFDDLQPLKPVLAGKRVVQLGESGHGVKEFSEAKVRLIRFLHEEMGYDVVAFESGILECGLVDRAAPTAPTAEILVRRCLYGVWHTREVLELFEYIRSTWGTPRPLHVAGVDIQPNIPTVGPRPILVGLVAAVDTAYARRVGELETAFVTDYWSGYSLPLAQRAAYWRDLEAREGYRARYDSLMRFLDTHAAAMADVFPGEPALLPLARQHAYSRTRLVEAELAQLGTVAATEARDEGMADNLDALLDRVHPGKKVVVWAHNEHVRHDNASIVEPGEGVTSARTMGWWVSARHRAELYTVGLYMYRGQAAFNTRQVYPVLPPATVGSLEALFYTVRRKHFFVDLRGAERSSGTAWMDHVLSTYDWGRFDKRMVLRDQYDGLLFVDTVTPPDYY